MFKAFNDFPSELQKLALSKLDEILKECSWTMEMRDGWLNGFCAGYEACMADVTVVSIMDCVKSACDESREHARKAVD